MEKHKVVQLSSLGKGIEIQRYGQMVQRNVVIFKSQQPLEIYPVFLGDHATQPSSNERCIDRSHRLASMLHSSDKEAQTPQGITQF